MDRSTLRIVDHCDTLVRLTRDGGDDAAIADELDRVCEALLGASISNISEDAIKSWHSNDPIVAEWKRDKIGRCAAAGFDITRRSGPGAMLWAEEFALVIWAKSIGAVGSTESSA